jgi:hypothetical protein
MLLNGIKITRTKVPFEAIEVGGLKKSLMDGNKTCWISFSIKPSSPGNTTKQSKVGD